MRQVAFILDMKSDTIQLHRLSNSSFWLSTAFQLKIMTLKVDISNFYENWNAEKGQGCSGNLWGKEQGWKLKIFRERWLKIKASETSVHRLYSSSIRNEKTSFLLLDISFSEFCGLRKTKMPLIKINFFFNMTKKQKKTRQNWLVGTFPETVDFGKKGNWDRKQMRLNY